MRKVFLFMMVSVDGFFEGPNHEIDWHNVDADFNRFAVEQMNDVDTLLFGRRTYELMAGYWPTEGAVKDDPAVASLMNTLPKIVFSRTLETAGWSHTRLVKNDMAGFVRSLKDQTGRELAVFGSNDLSVSLIREGLLDDVRVMVNPIILGRGRPLFAGLDDAWKLKLIKTRTFTSGNVLHSYQVVKKG